MGPYVKPHTPTPLNQMVLPKENTVTLLKQLARSCCQPRFPVFSGGEVIHTAAHVINSIPTSHNSGFSPFEKLFGTAPDYSSMRVFGSTCFVFRPHVLLTTRRLTS